MEPGELTLHGLSFVMQSNDQDMKKIIVQFLELKQAPAGHGKEGVRICYHISDGFTKKTAVLANSAVDRHSASAPQPLDIIEIDCFATSQNTSRYIIAFSFTILVSPVHSMVGSPVTWEEFARNNFSNPHGNNQIPHPSTMQAYPGRPGVEMYNDYGPPPDGLGYCPPQGKMGMMQPNGGSYGPTPGYGRPTPASASNSGTFFPNGPPLPMPNGGPPPPMSNGRPPPGMRRGGPSNTGNGGGMPYLPGNGGPGGRMLQGRTGPPEYQPISHLTIYNESWVIRGRVISKSDIKTWVNDKGSGKFFKIVLADESAKIQASFFNTGCDKFYEMIQENMVYSFSDGKLKTSSGKFNSTKHDYEISFDESSSICMLQDDGTVGPGVSLVPISELKNRKQGELVDVIGLVVDGGRMDICNLKSGVTKSKRIVMIVDEAMVKIEVTLWGPPAEYDFFTKNTVLIFRQVRIGNYQNNLNLTFMNESQIVTSLPPGPRIDSILNFRANYDPEQIISHSEALGSFGGNQGMGGGGGGGGGAYFGSSGGTGGSGGNQVGRPPQFFHNLEQVDSCVQQMGTGLEEKQFFTIIGYCANVKGDALWYPACPTEGCMKKVIETGTGWICNGCHMQVAKPSYRYVSTIRIVDCYSSVWCKLTEKSGKCLFGFEADYLQSMKARDEMEFKEFLNDRCNKQKRFSIVVKNDNYQGECRKNFMLINVFDDVQRENKSLLGMLEAYSQLP